MPYPSWLPDVVVGAEEPTMVPPPPFNCSYIPSLMIVWCHERSYIPLLLIIWSWEWVGKKQNGGFPATRMMWRWKSCLELICYNLQVKYIGGGEKKLSSFVGQCFSKVCLSKVRKLWIRREGWTVIPRRKVVIKYLSIKGKKFRVMHAWVRVL